MMVGLTFGYSEGVPSDYDGAVWGARLIFPNDLLFDRQSNAHTVPERDAAAREADTGDLHNWLNGKGRYTVRALRLALDAAPCGLRYDENREVVLYEDEHGIIVGNPLGSHGYLYIAAWLKGGDSDV